MQAVLGGLNAVPGVAGSMVCDVEGRVQAQAFPESFDPGALQQAASVLADGSVGLETVTGPIGVIDLRYGEARVIAKPTTGGMLLLLCTKALNLQMLMMSVSVASRKLEKLAAEAPAVAALASAPEAEGAAPQTGAPQGNPDEPAGSAKPKKKAKWWPSV
jgi:predicted regulator of Ras-like GTPase activity (Roadblock/LC7/MglB family)